MGLLESIHAPQDLRTLDMNELKELAQEIRQEMIDVVSKNGGHLAPNLGVVELTLALHRTFDSPRDKIVWDVGHQTYVHKLLTGRLHQFKTIRQYNGMSGFPKRAESACDCFETGHSSTSISAAVGFAKARDVLGESHNVVAVIGEGAMTGGMAYEALNHAGHSETNMIVVLNDNEMSISPNVGAMSSYLSRLRSDPRYDKRKEDIEYLLKRIPVIGTKVAKAVAKAKDSLKYLLVPGLIFEELGFTYLGPIDGHDQALVEQLLNQAANKKGPVLVHVVTRKGKGYKPAEENPDIFHGVGPFEPKTGKIIKKPAPPTYTAVFGETLCSIAKEDPKPVVAIYSTFYQRAYDQVLHDVCLQQANVVLAIDRAGVVGDDGPTHHGVFDISFFRIIPNLIFMAPKDENELQHMLYTALQHCGPVALRYPRSVGQGVTMDETLKEIPIGKAEVLREGKDVTLIGIGPMANTCLQAAQELRKHGVDAAVINLRFISPLDRVLILHYARLTKKIVTVEDHILKGSMGSAILELLDEEGIDGVALERLGYDGFVDQGPISRLHDVHGLSVKGIVQAAERLLHPVVPSRV